MRDGKKNDTLFLDTENYFPLCSGDDCRLIFFRIKSSFVFVLSRDDENFFQDHFQHLSRVPRVFIRQHGVGKQKAREEIIKKTTS